MSVDPNVDHRVSGLDARLERLLDSLLDGGDELGRDRPTSDLVHEVEALARRRLEIDHRMPVLATAAGLADESAMDLFHRAANRLAVGHLRPADVGVHLELAQEAVDDHLEMELPHPRYQRLTGLLVRADLERGVLLR